MWPYWRTYQLAFALTAQQLRQFKISRRTTLRYARKAGNLGVCFLGFAIHRGEEYFKRSAELGMLASIYDLASDELDFEQQAYERFKLVLEKTVEPEAVEISLHILEKKRRKNLDLNGLERGIGALRVIALHLNAHSAWACEADVIHIGTLLQVVDDVLDYEDDIFRNELNFLTFPNAGHYVQQLLEWDHEQQFQSSAYPAILFPTIRRAKASVARMTAA